MQKSKAGFTEVFSLVKMVEKVTSVFSSRYGHYQLSRNVRKRTVHKTKTPRCLITVIVIRLKKLCIFGYHKDTSEDSDCECAG